MDTKEDNSSDSEVRVPLVQNEEDDTETDEIPEEWDVADGRPRCSSMKEVSKLTFLDYTRSSVGSKKLVLKSYKRRWFILGLFSLLSFMQVSCKSFIDFQNYNLFTMDIFYF
jgi:hypothetical protein